MNNPRLGYLRGKSASAAERAGRLYHAGQNRKNHLYR